jgi:hypothetical protein
MVMGLPAQAEENCPETGLHFDSSPNPPLIDSGTALVAFRLLDLLLGMIHDPVMRKPFQISAGRRCYPSNGEVKWNGQKH